VQLSADVSVVYTVRLSVVSSVGGMLLREGGWELSVREQIEQPT
jgi:hypothetical protein